MATEYLTCYTRTAWELSLLQNKLNFGAKKKQKRTNVIFFWKMSAKVEKSKDDNSTFDAEAPVNNAVQQRLLDYFSA